MAGVLNAGQGSCRATARLLLSPVRAAIELGAATDVLHRALNAVHHANRHASQDDFIAVGLPLMHLGREGMLPGHEIELIGSETSLGSLLDLDGIKTLFRRGMLKDTEVGEVFLAEGMPGAAYIRDRRAEKHSAGWVRRSQARAARNGREWKPRSDSGRNAPPVLTLHYGETTLHIRELQGEWKEEPVSVNTYGFSAAGSPCILPIVPASIQEIDDAA